MKVARTFVLSLVPIGICLLTSSCNRSSSNNSSKNTVDTTENGNTADTNAIKDGTADTKSATDGEGDGPAAAPPVQPIPKADVQALLDRWLEAQNQGDFETYESLYAKRLEGVRRSGQKVVRLNREGWFTDRKRMFKRKMEVELSDVEIDVFAQSAIATFTQRWASGRYDDVGPKQLVVVREDGAVRIAREEMLASTLIDEARPTSLADDNFLFVIEHEGASYAVLEPLGDVPVGKLRLISDGDPVVVAAHVSAKDLSVDVARWQGQRIGDDTCVATVDEILALSRVVPHFGERQAWSGGIDNEYEAFTETQIAEAAFHNEAAYLVGRLEHRDGDACSLAPFSHVAGKGAAIGDAGVNDAALQAAVKQAALQAFIALDSYQEVQKEFAAEGLEGSWHEFADGGVANQPDIIVSRHPKKQSMQVLVSTKAGVGCGQFESALSAYFKVTGSAAAPKLQLLWDSPSYVDVIGVVDVDGDGELEYVVKGFSDISLMNSEGDTLRTISVAYFDCAC